MKIHLKQIPHGGTLHLEGSEPAKALDLESDGYKALSDLHYILDAGISDGGLFVTGRLEIEMELQCVSCLQTFSHRMVLDAFATQIELPTTESVDLTPEIRDDILLDLPAYPKCDADGIAKCPASFPTVDVSPAEDRPAESGAVWDALKQLKPEK